MLSAKWIERDRITVAVSPADECICLLSNPACLKGDKSKDMRSKRKGRALVMRNNYMTYTMTDVPPLPDYKVVLLKGQFNGIRAQYNIRMDRTLAWAGQHCVGLSAAVAHARINSKGCGCCAATSLHSHAMR